ncbi:MAG: hypothetical protein DBY41_04560 [Clostridium sp.]|nr:MAG: hypothetical protein DBY41_04560 [Clostridium sp.]
MENIEYKTIKIKDYDLFEKGSACLINEGYVIHKKPTFISFVSERKDSHGLRIKITFSAKKNDVSIGYVGYAFDRDIHLNSNIKYAILDIAESLGMQFPYLEDNLNSQKDDLKDLKTDEENENVENSLASSILSTPFNKDFNDNFNEINDFNKNNDSNKLKKNDWISIFIKKPLEDELVQVAYTFKIHPIFESEHYEIGYTLAYLSDGRWYLPSDGIHEDMPFLHTVLAWKKHDDYKPRKIKGFYEKNYDFVCIKTPKNEIVGTMVIFQGKVVWKTQNDYIDDENVVLGSEEWSKEDIGIFKGLTLIIVK